MPARWPRIEQAKANLQRIEELMKKSKDADEQRLLAADIEKLKQGAELLSPQGPDR